MRLVLTLAYLTAAVISALAAVLLLRRRGGIPAAPWLTGMILAAGLWALCDAIELHVLTQTGKRLISGIQYFGIASTAPHFFMASLALADIRRPRGFWLHVAVWGIPVISIALALTSGWHSLLWREIVINPRAAVTGVYYYGPWFWVFNAHAYLLLAAATGLVVKATRQVTPPFRVPLWVVVVAVLVPWVGNAMYVYKLTPVPGLNWSSIAVLFTAILLTWAVARRGLVDVLPAALDVLRNSLNDGVVITDASSNVLFSNEAGLRLLWNGRTAGALPNALLEPISERGEAPHSWHGEVALDNGTWLDVRSDPVRGRWNEVAGHVLVFRDSTARIEMEAERERLIQELQQALAEVRTLSDLLPMCSGCRRLREEDGEWTQLEEYVQRHAGVEFSHGLCPDCLKRIYPEFRTLPKS